MKNAMPTGIDFDMRAGKTLAPTIVFIGYGIVEFLIKGTSSAYWLDTYVPVLGGIASWISVLGLAVVIFPNKFSRESPLRRLAAFCGYVPMLYSLYAICYLGFYLIYHSIFVSFSAGLLVFALISILLGYRMAYGLQSLTGMFPHSRALNG